MAILYTVHYGTSDGKAHSYLFPSWYSGNLLQQACDMCVQLGKRENVVWGLVYDEVHKSHIVGFDKEEV